MGAPKGRPRPPGSGRKKGTPNKATADIKALAAVHGPRMIEVLAELAERGDSDKVRVAAATALLDRGFGRPAQAVDMTHQGGLPGSELIGAFFATLARKPDAA